LEKHSKLPELRKQSSLASGLEREAKQQNETINIPLRGHIPQAVVLEVLEDISKNKTYRQIKEDYSVSLGWIHKVRHNKIRK